MALNVSQIINDTITHNKVYRLQSELDILEAVDSKDINPTSIYRTTHIKKILTNIDNDENNKYEKDNNLLEHKKLMKYAIYKVRWHTLSIDHRLNRLNEYLERMLVNNTSIKSRLVEMISDKTLKTKDVDYRIDIGKIISIKILSTNNGEFILNDPNNKVVKKKSKSSKTKTAKVSKDKTAKVSKDKTAKASKDKTVKASKASKDKTAKASKDKTVKASKASKDKTVKASKDKTVKASKASKDKTVKASKDKTVKASKDKTVKASKASKDKTAKASKNKTPRSKK
jgi:hypothetical protein